MVRVATASHGQLDSTFVRVNRNQRRLDSGLAASAPEHKHEFIEVGVLLCPKCRHLFAACICAAQLAGGFAHDHEPDSYHEPPRYALTQRPVAIVGSRDVTVRLTGQTTVLSAGRLVAKIESDDEPEGDPTEAEAKLRKPAVAVLLGPMRDISFSGSIGTGHLTALQA